MALPVAPPRFVGIRDVVTALSIFPRAVPPTNGQIPPPDLLHGAGGLCVCSLSGGRALIGSMSVPNEMKSVEVKGCWDLVSLAGTSRSLLLSFING